MRNELTPRDLPELFIMVPALIGLKGNLEMTLASRYLQLYRAFTAINTVNNTI